MFEPVIRDDDGVVIDPRDLPRSGRMSLFCASQLDRFTSVLSANVEALDEDNQLELAAQLSSCVATMEWVKCRVASSLALKDAASPMARSTERGGRGEPVQRRLGGPGTPDVSEFLVTEVALAFGCSEREATSWLAVGLDLRFRLRCTNAEFGGGRISYGCAKVISEETRHLSAEAAEALDSVLADAASTRTPARLRVLARKKAAAADPDALAARHRAAMSNRGAAMFSIGDGMGAFSLTGPLETMAVVDDSIDAWARTLRSQAPSVPLAAHRADAATRLLLGQHPVTGHCFLPGGESRSSDDCTNPLTPRSSADGHRPELTSAADAEPSDSTAAEPATKPASQPLHDWLPARTELRVTMSADTLLGIDDATCDLQGYGPITAAQARRLALQSAPTTLRRVFTDPGDNSVLFLDARRYRFTREQLEAIACLHPQSTFPGATTPARRCDLDHVREYNFGGAHLGGDNDLARRHGSPRHTEGHGSTRQTSENDSTGRLRGPDPPGQTVVANGQPLSRRHHRLKTHGGWKVLADPDDPHTFHWTSPRGRTYTTNDTEGA